MLQAVIQYWFYELHVKELYRTRWFPKDQTAADSEINTKFGSTLTYVENEYHGLIVEDKETALAIIIVLDQFSRHIYRKEKEKIRANDVLAVQMAQRVLDRNWHLEMEVAKGIFSLMPFRHRNESVEELEGLLVEIENMEDRQNLEVDLLRKFKAHTVNRMYGSVSKEAGEEVLEHFGFTLKDESGMEKHEVYKAMERYIESNGLRLEGVFVVSLSGGVDSMVVAKILGYYGKLHGCQVVAVHIDYDNRKESGVEADFVQKWCRENDIVFRKRVIHQVTRGITKREEYERVAREIRYGFYKEMLNEYHVQGLFFGHHKGDVQENVISNLMKGLSILDVNGMEETSVCNRVKIQRPLLSLEKAAIFDFAHTFGVPYFKDTTPHWSTRGKLRNKLVPLLSEMYGDGFLNNLTNVGVESMQCQKLINQTCLQPLLSQIKTSTIAIIVPCDEYRNHGVFFWKEILRHICHKILSTSMIRDKSVQLLIEKLEKRKIFKDDYLCSGQWITLKKENYAFLTSQNQLILFRSHFFKATRKNSNPTLQVPCSLQDPSAPDPSAPEPIDSAHLDHKENCLLIQYQSEIKLNDQYTIQMAPVSELERVQYMKPQTILNVSESGKVQYVLLKSDQYILQHHHRPKQLRSVAKKVTDEMPIVAPYGATSVSYVLITIIFQ